MSAYPGTVHPPPPAYATQNGGPPAVATASNGGAPVPDSYFTESRKGEINELRNLLRGFATERDPQRKREIIKKVRLAAIGCFVS